MPDSFQNGLAAGAAFRLALPREALRGASGVRAGAGAGSSLDFLDFREYHPGDDLRRIDWNVFARTDREVVKLYREEVLPKASILTDGSASMGYDGAKRDFARFLAGAFESAARAAGAAATHWDFSHTPFSVRREDGSATLPRHSVRILLSDLLWPEDPEETLRRLAPDAAALYVVQTLLPDEEDPSFAGPHRLRDAETGAFREIVLDDASLTAYRTALAAHRTRWADACRRHGASFVSVTPGAPLPALLRAGILESN